MHALKPLTVSTTMETPRVSYRLTDQGLVTFIGQRRERQFYSFDVTRLSLHRHIPDAHLHKSKDLLKLCYLSYLYILRLANTKMIRRLTDVHKDVVTATKEAVFDSPELVNLKIATLRCVAQRLTPADHQRIVDNFVRCELKPEDAILFHLLYHNNDIPDFIANIKAMEDPRFVATPEALRAEMNDPKTLASMEKTASVMAWRRVRFIADGNRIHPSAYASDLLLKGMQSYYWVRPWFSKAYALNYAKRAINNQALVLIEECKKDEMKQRTVATKDGYENITRSYEDGVDYGGDVFAQENAMIAYLDRDFDEDAHG